MEIKHLKEKWIIYWEEIWEIGNEKHTIRCSNFFNSEKKALDFEKILKEGREIIRGSIKDKK